MAGAANDLANAMTTMQKLLGDSTEYRELAPTSVRHLRRAANPRPIAERIIAKGEEDLKRRNSLEEENPRRNQTRNHTPPDTARPPHANPKDNTMTTDKTIVTMPDSLDLDLGLQWTNAKQLSDDERRTLSQQVRSGEVTELTIEILAFRAVYPNSNYLRFHDHELPAFAASFANQPFLRKPQRSRHQRP